MCSSKIIGMSPAIHALKQEISIVARSEATVLVNGESGTGKELVARSIHAESCRSACPFIAVNLAAVNEHIAESELFGHKRGSFTGADRDHQGYFVKAHGGTLFLDEIGDLSPSMQVKLLRVLQEREVWPVGANVPVRFDVRVIAATHRNLCEMTAERSFREDLFYRLNNYPIHVPALRERGADIWLLFTAFIRQYSAKEGYTSEPLIDSEVKRLIESWRWPGNVRELQNVAYATVLRTTNNHILPNHLPPSFLKLLEPPTEKKSSQVIFDIPTRKISSAYINERTSTYPSIPENGLNWLDKQEMQKWALFQALERCNGNRAEAARQLNISRSTLYRSLKRFKQCERSDVQFEKEPNADPEKLNRKAG